MAWSVAAALAAEPAGTYQISGSSPGGATYKGTVTVTQNGQAYKLMWHVGSSTYNGSGIATGNSFAVSYGNASDSGIILFQANSDGWNGLWVHNGGNSVGVEVWKRE
jgi:hypothetical protein